MFCIARTPTMELLLLCSPFHLINNRMMKWMMERRGEEGIRSTVAFAILHSFAPSHGVRVLRLRGT
jgi:hypothetical protein